MNNFINDLFKEYEDELNILYDSSVYDLIIRPENTSIPFIADIKNVQ